MKNFFVTILVLGSCVVFAQTTDGDGRNWTTGSNWVGGTYPGSPGTTTLTFGPLLNININHYTIVGSNSLSVTMNFDGSNNNPGALTVGAQDTLIIFGNVTFANKSMEMVIGSQSVLIIIGNLTMSNKIVVDSDGVLVVSGQFNMTGSAAQSDYSGAGNVYAGSFAGNAETVIDASGDGNGDSSFTIGQLSDDGFSDIEDFINNSQTDPLPVELISFSTKQASLGILLQWQTATELNNDYFDIERSEDGVIFYKIARLAGKGTTDEVQHYQYIDKAPIANVEYYRLKQVDYDGAFEYSKTIVGYADHLASQLQMSAYPNPAAERVAIKSVRPVDFTEIQLINIAGQRVENLLNKVVGSGLNYEVALPVLDKGLYYIKYRTADGQSGTHKLMIR